MARAWPIRKFRKWCEHFREIVLTLELATPEEIAERWPGGKENPGRDYSAWMSCYFNLGRFMGRLTDEQASDVDPAIADQALADALRGAPVTVDLVDGSARAVYPKSWHALIHCTERDGWLDHLQATYRSVEQTTGARAVLLRGQLLQEINYQLRVLVWIVCHEEPGLPFADGDMTPTPPDWTETLHPLDFPRLVKANQVVNGLRLSLVFTLLAPKTDGTKVLSFATLVTAAADRLKIPARRLARDETLESVIAQLAVTVDREQAAQTAARERPHPVEF